MNAGVKQNIHERWFLNTECGSIRAKRKRNGNCSSIFRSISKFSPYVCTDEFLNLRLSRLVYIILCRNIGTILLRDLSRDDSESSGSTGEEEGELADGREGEREEPRGGVAVTREHTQD